MTPKIIGWLPKDVDALVLCRTRQDRYECHVIRSLKDAHHIKGIRADAVIVLKDGLTPEETLDIRLSLCRHISDNSNADCVAVDGLRPTDD